MIKILEAISVLLLARFQHHAPAPEEPGLGMEFVLSKSRVVMIGMFLAIIVAILFSVGVSLILVGGSLWYADGSNPLAHALLTLGAGTSVLCALLGMFGLSKKRFNIDEEHEKHSTLPAEVAHEPRPRPTQIIEEVVVAVIKDFLKETKASKTAAMKEPTSSSSPPHA